MAIEDPKDLKRADQEIRINELREQVNELPGGEGASFTSKDCPPEIEEKFLQNVLDFERMPVTSNFERLRREGIELPEPASLTDEQVTSKLWEVIEALGRMNTFLSSTNHLSDRRLYEHLWSETLHEAGPDFPPDSGWRNHIDILGSGSEEDIRLHLKYYADDEDRAFWAKEWPDMDIPPHEDPPYDRDRRLPKPPPEEYPPQPDDLEPGEADDAEGEDDMNF